MRNKTPIRERLRALKERSKENEPFIEPGPESSDFRHEEWFDRIRTDPSSKTIDGAISYYKKAVIDGRYYVVPVGNLQTLVEQLPGLLYYYSTILTDCQQSRKLLEIRRDSVLAERKRYYMIDPEAINKFGQLKVTEVSAMASSDPMVQEAEMQLRRMADAEHKLNVLVEALENMKYVLHNLVTIRKEGLEEVWIDPTKE